MLRDDYVLRLAAQFARSLAHVLGLTRRRDYPAALAAIDEALDQLLGLQLDATLDLAEAHLLAVLTLGGLAAAEGRAKAAFLAALLREAGAIHAAHAERRPSAAYECRCKALNLVLMIAPQGDGDGTLPSYTPAVADLLADLSAYALPADTSLLLARHYEGAGAYARAEDALFAALAAEPGNPAILATGRAFYERLLQQSDAALIAGNLPRDEVAAGLVELGRYRQEETN